MTEFFGILLINTDSTGVQLTTSILASAFCSHLLFTQGLFMDWPELNNGY